MGTKLPSAKAALTVALSISLVAAAGLSATGLPLSAHATMAGTGFGVGTAELATPTTGNAYVFVSTSGDDQVRPPAGSPSSWRPYARETCLADRNDLNRVNSWARGLPVEERCPLPDEKHPLRTIQKGILVTGPGDVLVVRAGTYEEQLGWSAKPGTQSNPIVVQAYPGERVDVLGYLNLKNPDWWTVAGFRFGYSPSKSTNQGIVQIAGGVSWRFQNNEVSGTRGVANVLIEQNGSSYPTDYRVAGNCIHDNLGTDSHGLDHNIYLKPGIRSSGGVIEYNLISGAPRGSNIKAGGSTDPAGAPRNVEIRYNTLMNAASGVIVGQQAEGVNVHHNVIAQSLNSDYYDGAIKTYALVNPTANKFSYNVFSGYANQIRETGDVRVYVPTTGNTAWDAFSYTGSVPGCTVTLADPQVSQHYGHRADSSAPMDPAVERLAGNDRFATSVRISQEFQPGVSRVYLATGYSYADALSAGPAAAVAGGPLLLTLPNALPDSVRAELQRLHPAEIVIVGGQAAVNAQVEAALKKLGFTTKVTRIAGDDRYDTSRRLAEFAFGDSSPRVAYIASGLNFPDALAAGPAAGDAGGPVILVNGAAKSADAALTGLLDDLGVSVVKIAGGTSAVSTGIQKALASWKPVRLAGGDRFGTANAINADQFKPGDGVSGAYLATGYSFADALAGSALAGAQGVPLYIAQPNCVPSATVDAFESLGVDRVALLGGSSVLQGGVAGLFSC